MLKKQLNFESLLIKLGLNNVSIISRVMFVFLLFTQFTPHTYACLLHMPYSDMKYMCFVGVYNNYNN